VPYGFDIVSIRIEYERAVIGGMVVSRAGLAVISPACAERSFVEAMNLSFVFGLEREVDKRSLPVSTVNIKFIDVEVSISFSKPVQ